MKKIFKFICCGSVDDGKSTLIGRLLVDTDNVKKDQLADAIKASERLGSEKLEYGMLLDGLLSEREQQITIDIAHRYFNYRDVRFHILDCPGHKQYTKNMAIAAAMVDTAILVVDVTKGISEQTRCHLDICKRFHIKNICCCLTKIDLVSDVENCLASLKVQLMELADGFKNFDIIPVSAIAGINIDKVLEKIIEYSNIEVEKNENKILHIHGVKVFEGKRYYYAFPVENAVPKISEKYMVYNGNEILSATIAEVVGYGCFRIEEDIDVQQGDVFALKSLIASDAFSCEIEWFNEPTEDMLVKHGTRVVKVVSYNKNSIKTDRPLFVSDIEQVKENSMGIVIDNVSKKTLACVVFKGKSLSKDDRKSNVSVATNEIFFNSEIISQVGLENVEKVEKYLQNQGFVVHVER